MNESSQGELTINSSTRQALDPDTKEDELGNDVPDIFINTNTDLDLDIGDKFGYTQTFPSTKYARNNFLLEQKKEDKIL